MDKFLELQNNIFLPKLSLEFWYIHQLDKDVKLNDLFKVNIFPNGETKYELSLCFFYINYSLPFTAFKFCGFYFCALRGF